MPQLIVSMTLGLGSVILYESTLSYLGLGVQLPHAAWGTMIASVNKPEVLAAHWNMWVPAGIMIVIAVFGFNSSYPYARAARSSSTTSSRCGTTKSLNLAS